MLAMLPQTGMCANRADVPVPKMANSVACAVDDAENELLAILDVPGEQKTARLSVAVPQWYALWRAGRFKTDLVRRKGTTDAGNEQQRRYYAKCVGWDSSFGLAKRTCRKSLVDSKAGAPRQNQYSVSTRAVLACRAVSHAIAAAAAARNLGGTAYQMPLWLR